MPLARTGDTSLAFYGTRRFITVYTTARNGGTVRTAVIGTDVWNLTHIQILQENTVQTDVFGTG